MERKREAFEQVTAQAQDLLAKQRQDYEEQRAAIALQHQEHMETMRKQNDLLQEEVKKTRELYSQTYQQFEVVPPQVTKEESRALIMQSMMTKNFQKKAERYKADYEVEFKRRQQKEKDLEEAEARIKKLKDEISSLEDSFEIVAKRPLMKSELDSPELHAEKKVKIEEVASNLQVINDERSAELESIKKQESIKKMESIKNKESTEKVQSIKRGRDIKKVESIKKAEKMRSTTSKSRSDSEEVLELNSEGDIVGKGEAVEEPVLRAGIRIMLTPAKATSLSSGVIFAIRLMPHS